MTSVVVPYSSNQHGLAVTLTGLQSQLVPPDLIVVVDTSADRSGLAIARRYRTHNVPIVVEHAQVPIYAAWNKGIALSGAGADVIVVNDDLLLPQNFVAIMTTVRRDVPAFVIVPRTPAKGHRAPTVTAPFAWYAGGEPRLISVDWMPGYCFMLTAECVAQVGTFDERFEVWRGDADYERRVLAAAPAGGRIPIVCIHSLYVYHYGGTSHAYASKEVKAQIARDRAAYRQKYGDDEPPGHGPR
jgi:GT2 family glycosyltransferase